VETKTRRQASLRHHPKASLAFNTNRKTSRQKLKCFKEITSCPGREKLECTDKRIQVHKSTKQIQEAATSRQVFGGECCDDRTKREVGQVAERDRRTQLMIRENYGWQDSREAGDQAINQRMFSELR
jgi:hypothetical protein